METTPQLERQAMGCGWEPPAPPNIDVRVWDHPARDPEGEAPLTTCPGFTCSLPEVREVSFARMHWKQNQLQVWARGKVNELLLRAVEALELNVQACDQWELEESKKGGD